MFLKVKKYHETVRLMKLTKRYSGTPDEHLLPIGDVKVLQMNILAVVAPRRLGPVLLLAVPKKNRLNYHCHSYRRVLIRACICLAEDSHAKVFIMKIWKNLLHSEDSLTAKPVPSPYLSILNE